MEISQIVCLGILIIISVIDIKYRKIPVGVLAAANIGALVYQCLCYGGDILLIIGGMMTGAVFLIISKVTGEGIGYGDSMGILGLGIYVGLWNILEILAGAFFVLAVCAIAVLIKKKMSRKGALPFYPFLTIAYIIWVAEEIKV